MKSFLFCIALSMAVTLQAQQPKDNPPDKNHVRRHQPITKMVSNLSAPQKKKLETLEKDSHLRVKALRQSQHALRDSIHYLMELDGDHSAQLNPLFEREGQLQAMMSREMYSTRLAVDEILTDKQRKELKSNIERQRPHRKHPKMRHKGSQPKVLNKDVKMKKSNKTFDAKQKCDLKAEKK